ncbi:MAG: 4-alpha-glucanotransferase [Gemmatimonadota bacterium]|nr:4-alpha-glucanotransferase [Gemmatimonadota bacterium]
MSGEKARPPTLRDRAAGILLHPTSLPGPGMGSIGEGGRHWIGWLAEAGQRVWQILPLVPTGEGGSPYDGLSAFAGNPWLIDLEPLAEAGLLDPGRIRGEELSGERIDYGRLTRWKEPLLREAYGSWTDRATRAERSEKEDFAERSRDWLRDYTLFIALRAEHGGAGWTDWSPPLRHREPRALRIAEERLREELDLLVWQQWVFDRQWRALRSHANDRGVAILGDIPIFVAHDSADVWAHPELFRLDRDGSPEVVSGVPPDYFSETGQRWGNPLYRWEVMRRDGFAWWTERFRVTLQRVDAVRIDHFRGFEAAWEIPAEEETAVKGEWGRGPGRRFFEAVRERLGDLPLVAEDLGLITPEVEALRDELGLPGMRVLQFAWDGSEDNPHLPANTPANALAYTGTHDNDTVVGWWNEIGAGEQARVRAALGSAPGGSDPEIHWALIRMVLDSPARWAIVPAQDVLGLGCEARMNTPGIGAGNWGWRLPRGAPGHGAARRLREAIRASGREAAS